MCAVTVGFYVLSRSVCLVVIDDDIASFSNAGSVDLFQFWCVVQCPRQRVSLNCHGQLLTVLTLLILDLYASGYSSLLGASESTVSRAHVTKQRVLMQHKLSCSGCLLSHLVLYPYSLWHATVGYANCCSQFIAVLTVMAFVTGTGGPCLLFLYSMLGNLLQRLQNIAY